MARVDLRNAANADGDWFVDTRCIDCGTCRELAPSLFTRHGSGSIVRRQPVDGDATDDLDAWLAAQACPTRSIGTISRRARPGRLYPREVAPGSGVFDLGYCSEDSYGASAWLVVRPDGNILVDSPRWTEALVAAIEELGGLRFVALTHRDDVADAHRYAERFGATTWIHDGDRRAAPWAEHVLVDETTIAPGFVAIPVPGHTRGSVVFLLDDHWLFTGDSLAWSHDRADVLAFRDACWYSWPTQLDSLQHLAETHRFAALLPGHGARHLGDADDLHARVLRYVAAARDGLITNR